MRYKYQDATGRTDNYLGANIRERRGRDDGEAHQEDIGARVRQRTKSVVILLSGSIPETFNKSEIVNCEDDRTSAGKFSPFAVAHDNEKLDCIHTKADHAAINHDVRAVVIEHGRNVLLREAIRGICDKEACLSDSSAQE